MKPKRIHTDYLRDIVEYSDKATRFVQGLDFETFRKDEQLISKWRGKPCTMTCLRWSIELSRCYLIWNRPSEG